MAVAAIAPEEEHQHVLPGHLRQYGIAFAQARSDNGAVRALKVQQVPALFLAQPFSGRIEPVGFGVLSEAQLGERIVALFEGRDGKGTPPPVFWSDQRKE